MKIGALVSSGKDSLFAAFTAAKEHELCCLITLVPKRNDSYMFHIPNLHLVPMIAEAMGLPLIMLESSGEKEKELADLKNALAQAKEKHKIKGVTSGAIASSYQKERVDKLCKELELESIAPLWHIDEEQYLLDLIDNDFEVMIVGIAAQGFNESWLGRIIDFDCSSELHKMKEKYHISLVGEGGEYETLVVNCPLYDKRLNILKSVKKLENEHTGQLVIEDAVLKV